MKKFEIVNREVRDVTYEVVIEDNIYDELQSLSQAERLAFFESLEKEWQLIDWGAKRIETKKRLNVQAIDVDLGRRITNRYQEIYSTERHDHEADPELRKEKLSSGIYDRE